MSGYQFGPGYYGGNGGGRPIRWVLGLLIVLFGVIRYMSQTQVNPVTGEKQHLSMSSDQELMYGLAAAPQMAQQMGGEVDPANDPQAAEVQNIGSQIASRSDASRSPYAGHFQYHLLNDNQTINAFALPGGQIFITRALLVRLENEAELAGVLGHETGHVVCRHSAQQIEKSQLGQTLAIGVAVGSSGNRNGYAEAAAAQFANQMLQLHYSREDESQADEFGMKYMSQAGYDPSQMLGVMDILKKLEASSPGNPPAMLRTHPLATTRYTHVQDLLASNQYAATDGRPLTKGAELQSGTPVGQ